MSDNEIESNIGDGNDDPIEETDDPSDIHTRDDPLALDVAAEDSEQKNEQYQVKIKEQIQEKILINPENFQTSDILSLFEYTEIISVRIGQLENKFPCCIDDISDCVELADIAKKELRNGCLPLMIARAISTEIRNGKERVYIEMRDPNKMILPANV